MLADRVSTEARRIDFVGWSRAADRDVAMPHASHQTSLFYPSSRCLNETAVPMSHPDRDFRAHVRVPPSQLRIADFRLATSAQGLVRVSVASRSIPASAPTIRYPARLLHHGRRRLQEPLGA